VPYQASVNGRSGIATVLKGEEAQSECPYSGRPSQSSIGGDIALVCKDESGNVIGLFVASVASDGRTRLKQVAEDAWPLEGPTWVGDEGIIFVSADFEDRQTILRGVSAQGGKSERLTQGRTGWDTHPDVSPAGLLFLRSPDSRKQGDVWRLDLDTGDEDQLTTDGDAQSPTWSPDGSQFAFLAPSKDGSGQLSVWIQDTDVDAKPREIRLLDEDGNKILGKLGPPAWGSR
jgi:Tol biopolymer transport system component